MQDRDDIINEKSSEIDSLNIKLQNWAYATRNYIQCACYECRCSIWNGFADPTSRCDDDGSADQHGRYPFADDRCSAFKSTRNT